MTEVAVGPIRLTPLVLACVTSFGNWRLMMIVVLVFLSGGWGNYGRAAGGLLPVLLHSGRKFFDARQKRGKLPYLGIGERVIPCRHSGVANPVVYHEKGVPFRIIRWVEN